MKFSSPQWKIVGQRVLYLLVFAVMIFNFQRANKDIVEKGQFALAATMQPSEVTRLTNEANTAGFDRRIEIADLMMKHGWYRPAFEIIRKVLTSINSAQTIDRKAKQVVLQRLGRLYCKLMRYKEAELSLQDSIAQIDSNDVKTRISVLNDLLEIEIQSAKRSRERADRERSERMLNSTVNQLNKAAEKAQLDEKTKRMIQNHAQVALIELGRMLEVESYEHEPASILGL